MNRSIIKIIFTIILSLVYSCDSSKTTTNDSKNIKNRSPKLLLLLGGVEKYYTGERHYEIGNEFMNINEYDQAIEHYEKAYDKNYKKHNSNYNIACAKSLKGDVEGALYKLLHNYYEGDRNISRVHNDKDLLNFRNSKYYIEYKNKLSKIKPGIVPSKKEDILKYLYSVGTEYAMFCGSPGNIYIKPDGSFNFEGPGGWGGCWNVGKWSIDEEKQEMVFELTACMGPITDKHGKTISGAVRSYKGIIDRIPFKDIELNAISIECGDWCNLVVANRFGYVKKNKVIGYLIGREYKE